ncbi:MAG: glycosyltransferase [Planctomycetes bacterium]|nr:glycosyltransferase [Planctomycetota bacterium]
MSAASESTSHPPAIRLAICQPALPSYRVPVFNLLARQPGVSLSVFAGDLEGLSSGSDEAKDFQYRAAPIDEHRLGPLGFKFQQAMLDAADAKRFDLLILPWDAHYRSAAIAIRRARRCGLRTVLWGHGYSKRPRRWRTWMRNRMGKSADGVMLYTKTIADGLIRNDGFDADRVFVAQNALDQAPIQAARQAWLDKPDDLAAFQREHQLDAGKTIVFVSRLYADNRVDLLIEATANLAGEHPSFKTVIIGDGPDRERLTKLAAQRGIAERVVFTGKIYDQMKLAPWMMSSSVFCYPVNVGLSILHAFGYALPIVTSDSTAAQNPEIEALSPGVNGLTYRDGQVDDLASVIGRVLGDAAMRAKLSDGALRTVTDKYTLANMVQGFLDAMRLVDGRRRAVAAS